MRSLAEALTDAGGGPLMHEGRELYARYRVQVAQGERLRITFERSKETPVQGLGLHCEKCQLQAHGTTAQDLALWTDTAPREVELVATKVRSGAYVDIVNQWRDEKHGTTMYRLNSAAMEVVREEDEDAAILRCSDGWDSPAFDDLVVHVRKLK